MKNNKGFTLVELLAVITIIGLIMIVSFPNFSKMASSASDVFSNSSQRVIKSAASMYVNNNLGEVNDAISHSQEQPKHYKIPVKKLIVYEYLDESLLSKEERTNVSNLSYVKVTKSGNDFSYEIIKASNESELGGDYLPPVLKINKKQSAPSNFNCSTKMTTNTKTEFDTNCEVSANDNKDGVCQLGTSNPSAKCKIKVTRTLGKESLILEYTAIDEAGNKSLPLKIYLSKTEN